MLCFIYVKYFITFVANIFLNNSINRKRVMAAESRETGTTGPYTLASILSYVQYILTSTESHLTLETYAFVANTFPNNSSQQKNCYGRRKSRNWDSGSLPSSVYPALRIVDIDFSWVPSYSRDLYLHRKYLSELFKPTEKFLWPPKFAKLGQRALHSSVYLELRMYILTSTEFHFTLETYTFVANIFSNSSS